jgi:thiopeptide-type bacteriocin biosynthesis protein
MASISSPVARAYRSSEFFALRTALLPFRVLIEWADGVRAPGLVESAELAEAVAGDMKVLRTRLQSYALRAEIEEALLVASPSTHEALTRWLATASEDRRLERTVARYFQRMAGRATPFGLFAGCSVGKVAHDTSISISPSTEYRRYCRLDNDYLFALSDYIAKMEPVRDELRYRLNSTLYFLGGRWRLVQAVLVGTRRTDNLVAFAPDAYLNAAIECASHGATVDQIKRHICSIDADLDDDEAREYVHELIAEQVLVSDLCPIVTGPEPLEDAIDQLRRVPSAQTIVDWLESVRRRLRDVNASPLGIDVGVYRSIERMVSELGVTPDPSRLFQVDMVKPACAATCGAAVVDELFSAVSLLRRIMPTSPTVELWRRFKERFVERYERREVPLVEALDEESGIGFDAGPWSTGDNVPLLQGLQFSPPSGPAGGEGWSNRDAFLLSKVSALAKEGGSTLELSAADFDAMSAASPAPLPNALFVLATVVASRHDPGDDFRVRIRNAAGPSGATMLGRFCHADPELADLVKKHLRDEESLRPDAVFAEVVHLPDGRLGNIVCRPTLRQFEIPYHGRSGAAEDRQIPVTDLMVSVADDRVVLRSARLAREVIPRLTNAHNFRGGQPIYRFLCSLQTEGMMPGVAWTWGHLDGLSYLPRVTCGRIVFARAQWRMDRATLRRFADASLAEQFRGIQKWRAQWRVPRFITLVDADNELPIDLDNVLSVDSFLHLVTRRDSCVLVEMFPGPGELCAKGPEGHFAHEIVVPFVAVAESNAPVGRSVGQRAPACVRTFQPGSEWLYFKFYCGTSSVDSVLTDVIRPQLQAAFADDSISQWFFVRYADPHWHLRVRLRGRPDRLHCGVLGAIQEAMGRCLGERRAWKIQIDTYEREIERYGGDTGMPFSEEWFWIDSDATLEILCMLAGDQGIDARWRLALRSWDLMLSDLGFAMPERLEFVRESRATMARRLGVTKALDRAIGDGFRTHRRSLEVLFNDSLGKDDLVQTAANILRRRSDRLRPVAQQLREAAVDGQLTVTLRSLAASYLHMHANRMLRSSHQHQEFVMYDYLSRLYESALAKERRIRELRAAV